MSLPLYLISPSRDLHNRVAAAASVPPAVFESVREMMAVRELEPGIVLLDTSAVPEAETLMCAGWAARTGGGWCVAVVEEGDEGPVVRTISLGFPHTVEEAAAFAGDPKGNAGNLLELRRVLTEAGRLRHDVNNSLTTAMMEAQLLLLGDHPSEVAESLGMVEKALLQIRDLVKDSGHLRAGRG